MRRQPQWPSRSFPVEKGWVFSSGENVALGVEVTAMVWFDQDKETDWRIMSSPASAAAMAEALRRTMSRDHCRKLS